MDHLTSLHFTSLVHLDPQTAVAGDVEPVPGELVIAVIPLDDGLGRPEGLAAEPDLAAGHGPHHGLGGRGDLRGQRQHVDEHVLVHVAVHPLAGGVTPVVAGVLLGQVHDGDTVRGHCSPGVGRCLLDRLPVVDPLDLGRGVALRLALEGHGLPLGRCLTLGLLGEVGLGVHLELDGVALREPHSVTGLACVVALVIEVDVFDHQGLAIVVVGCSSLRQSAAFLCPSVNKQSLDTQNRKLKIKVFNISLVKNQIGLLCLESGCNPLRSDIKDYLPWQMGHKEGKHPLYSVPDLRQRRASEHAPHLDALAPVGHVVLPGDILPHWLVLVLETRTGPRLDNLE